MRVLLVTSAAPVCSPFFTSEKTPPLGVGYLISTLKRAGHETFFIDNYLKPSDFLETDFLERNKIDAVGIYANTICLDDTLRMIRRIERKRNRGLWKGTIMVGGPHASVAPETIPECVDYIVIGEGEKTILDILDGKIKDRIIEGRHIENPDELPRLPYDLFAGLDYKKSFPWFGQSPVFTLNTSRGCPFGCKFCSVGSIWGKLYRAQSAERVLDDVKWLMKDFGAKGIYFREDNFTLQKKRLIGFCEGLLRENIRVEWMCETRLDTLDESALDLMARSNCKGIYVGVETASPRLQKLLNKNLNIDHVRHMFEMCQKHGINIHASYVVGLPGETPEEEEATVKLSKELPSVTAGINVFVGIPTSPLYEQMQASGDYIFKDHRGMLFRQNHNERVKKYYGESLASRRAMIQSDEMTGSIERALPTNPDYQKTGYYDMLLERYGIAKLLAENKKVIDSCCGTAWGTFNFIAQSATQVTGVDISESGLKYYNFQHPKLTLLQSDVTDIDLPDNTFDLALALESIEHFEEVPGIDYFEELFRVLKPGGILMGTTPFMPIAEIEQFYLEMNPFHLKMYTVDAIVNLLNRSTSLVSTRVVWNKTCPYILFLAEKENPDRADSAAESLKVAEKIVNDALPATDSSSQIITENYIDWAKNMLYRKSGRIGLKLLLKAIEHDPLNPAWLRTATTAFLPMIVRRKLSGIKKLILRGNK